MTGGIFGRITFGPRQHGVESRDSLNGVISSMSYPLSWLVRLNLRLSPLFVFLFHLPCP